MWTVTISILIQYITCTLGILFNLLFCYIHFRSKKQELGFYRWLLLYYAIFEIIYAISVLFTVPIHMLSEYTWILFSFKGPLIGTSVAFLSSAIYCLFYEMWMGLVMVNFIYRYIAVCKPQWMFIIKERLRLKLLLFAVFLFFNVLCFLCTIHLCAANPFLQMRNRLCLSVCPWVTLHFTLSYAAFSAPYYFSILCLYSLCRDVGDLTMYLIKKRNVLLLMLLFITPPDETTAPDPPKKASRKRTRTSSTTHDEALEGSSNVGFFDPGHHYRAYPPRLRSNTILPEVLNHYNSIFGPVRPENQSISNESSDNQNLPFMSQRTYASFHAAFYPRGVRPPENAPTFELGTHNLPFPNLPPPIYQQSTSNSFSQLLICSTQLSEENTENSNEAARKESARIRKQASRAKASEPKKMELRNRNSISERERRNRQTEEERTLQRQHDAQRKARDRANETNEETQRRRQQVKTQMCRTRADQTAEQLAHRRRDDANQHAMTRALETQEETEERRLVERTRVAANRATETPEAVNRRLQDDAARHADTYRALDPSQLSHINTIRRQADRERRIIRVSVTLLAASTTIPPIHYLGPLNKECSYCEAVYFEGEVQFVGGMANACCNKGRIDISHFQNFPRELFEILTNQIPESKNFLDNIRSFNSSLATASMECKVAPPPGRGPPCFRVHGAINHYLGSALPPVGQAHSYGQLYFIDSVEADLERMGHRSNISCDPILMARLSRLFETIHPLAISFKLMGTVFKDEESKARALNTPMPDVTMVFKNNKCKDQRRYNAPTSNEVAVVFAGPNQHVPDPREYVVHLRQGGLNRISLTNQYLDSHIYPIFFPRGEEGWHDQIYKAAARGLRRSRLTMKEYYCHMLSIRRNVFNPIHFGRKLYQQFLTDIWVRLEQNRLNWVVHNQIRADLYQELHQHVADNEEGLAGVRVVLPASHQWSPRHFLEVYQDTMAVVLRYGKPDLFVTFTANPQWTEITENLEPGQSSSDRPDLVARVFNMKLKELLHDIEKKEIFGKVKSVVYVVEFQKRGLPHSHILITLDQGYKLDSPDKVDPLIRAELPDEDTEPELFSVVTRNMIHRKCGNDAPCMRDGKCSKNFPKSYVDETSLEVDGYAVYRRRNDGRTFTVGGETYNNTHVVPYNAYLLLKYNAHINVELVSLIHAVKYLYKYIYKGNDRAEIELRQEQRTAAGRVDEVQEHIDARYVCAPEAFHRIFSFPLHGRTHSVESLQVHLPDQQRVTFRPGNERRVLNNPASRETTLTAFFNLNQHYFEMERNGQALGPREMDSRNLTYVEIPEHFVFDKSGGRKVWKPRTNGGQLKVGRVHAVAVKEGERYALRRLLMTRKGARSFEDIRTIDGTVYPSFHEAADVLGLLHSTDHFSAAMNEAVAYQMPRQLRCLFSSLTSFVSPDEAARFWPVYKKDLASDYERQGYSEVESQALAYYDISDMVSVANIDLSKYIAAPLPNRPTIRSNTIVTNFTEIGEGLRQQLNPDQERIVEEIITGTSRLIFVDGPGGTGKTFVYSCLYNLLRGAGNNVVCSAFTGIAANLLPEGRTLCSLFRLNVAQECRSSSIKPNSRDGRYLKDLHAIIIDECSMISHWILDVIDATLRDVSGINEPFGGKIVLLGGDFRQILPIPSKTSGLKPKECSLKLSQLFNLFLSFHLTMNMRAAAETTEWKNYLLKIGNGEESEDEEGKIQLPSHILSNGDLITEVFGGVFNNPLHVSERAILCPKNKNVDLINDKILDQMDSEERVYFSHDSIDKNGELDHLTYPEEFLHSLSPNGLPGHKLRLKIGSVVMLLRNLNTANGLCNGTRLQVTRFARNVVTCSFINGSRIGQSVLIPRIELHSNQGMSFTLKRQQFPLRLAFAISLNKAQGQSLKCVGLDLSQDVFSHGHLYVGLSRASSSAGLKVVTKHNDGKTVNVVDKSVL